MGILDSIMTPISEAKDPLAEREKWLQMSQLFNSFTMNPNASQGYYDSQQKGIDRKRESIALRSGNKLEAEKLKRHTAQALQILGDKYPDISKDLLSGFLTPQAAVTEARNRGKGKFKTITGSSAEAMGLDPNKVYKLNVDTQELSGIGGGGTNIDINTSSEMGTIPTGYEVYTTDSGARALRPIQGGPAADKIAELEGKDVEAQGTTARTGGIVLQDIGRLRKLLSNQTMVNPVTGPTGSLAGNVPASSRSDAETLANTIKGNIGFDRLQQMRNESPTGGALGAINAQEMTLLSSVLGSLDLNQSESQLLENLGRLEVIYTEIMRKANAYPNAGGSMAPAAPSANSIIPTWNPITGKFE